MRDSKTRGRTELVGPTRNLSSEPDSHSRVRVPRPPKVPRQSWGPWRIEYTESLTSWSTSKPGPGSMLSLSFERAWTTHRAFGVTSSPFWEPAPGPAPRGRPGSTGRNQSLARAGSLVPSLLCGRGLSRDRTRPDSSPVSLDHFIDRLSLSTELGAVRFADN